MADQTSRIVAELERSECGELRLRRGSPLACGVMCSVSSSISRSLVGVKIGSNTALHCFVLQKKLSYSIKYVVYEIRRQNRFMYVFTSENTILNNKNIGEGSHTITVLGEKISFHHKEVQGLHTDNVLENFF